MSTIIITDVRNVSIDGNPIGAIGNAFREAREEIEAASVLPEFPEFPS